MKRFKIVGLCLMAVFALSAVATSAASAEELPEFLGTTNFTSHGGISKFKTLGANPKTVECNSVDNSGKITGPKTASVLVTFLGCKLSGVDPCTSGEGAGSEEVMTSSIDIALGYIKKNTHEVGVALTGLGGSERNLLATFECNLGGGVVLSAKVKGSVIGTVTPVNTSTLTLTINFAAEGSGKQAVKKFQGSTEEDVLLTSLNKGAFEESVEISTDELLLEKDVKIDA